MVKNDYSYKIGNKIYFKSCWPIVVVTVAAAKDVFHTTKVFAAQSTFQNTRQTCRNNSRMLIEYTLLLVTVVTPVTALYRCEQWKMWKKVADWKQIKVDTVMPHKMSPENENENMASTQFHIHMNCVGRERKLRNDNISKSQHTFCTLYICCALRCHPKWLNR